MRLPDAERLENERGCPARRGALTRVDERGHDRIAHRLDDHALAGRDDRAQDVEVVVDEAKAAVSPTFSRARSIPSGR